MPQPDPDIPARLSRVEEAVSFTDRAAEELSTQVIDLLNKMDAIERRLRQLEGRLKAFEAAEDEPQDAADDQDRAG